MMNYSIFDFRFSIADFRLKKQVQSKIENLKSKIS